MGLTTSCNKTEKKLIGKWQATSGTMIEGNGEPVIVGSIFTFNNDNTFSVTVNGNEFSGTFSAKDDNLIMTSSETNVGFYTLKTAFDMDILELTNKILTIEGTMTTTMNNGVGETRDVSKIRITMKKIK